jgi:hypothetical protein
MKRWLVLVLFCAATPLGAQTAGKAGAQVLQFNAGARAAALSGAYSAARGDADALFYNPSGIALARRGASLAYETFTIDVAFGSFAGFTRIGNTRIGASIAYLDAGAIDEIVPDPVFGGATGVATGNQVTASETAARLSFALPLQDGRLRVGASLGMVAFGMAEVSERAPIADIGAQFDVATVTVSAAVRNLGGNMAGNPLPTELRLGAVVPVRSSGGLGLNAFADAIARVREGSLGVAAGLEAGIIPRAASDIGAVARIGFDPEADQLSSLRFGAGVSLQSLSLDYAYQNFDFVGGVHRFGVRWTVR